MTEHVTHDAARLRRLADEYDALATKEAEEQLVGWQQRERLLREIAALLRKRQ